MTTPTPPPAAEGMSGAEGVAEALRAWLEERLPARLTMQSARLELERPLPAPGLVATEERGAVPMELWPVVYVLPRDELGMTLLDVLPGGVELYSVRYALRVLSWVRASDGFPDVATLRTRYALAVRETLLERKGVVGAADARSGLFHVDPTSIRASYSDPMADGDERTIAGVWTDVTVSVAEALTVGEHLGYGATIDVETLPAARVPNPDPFPWVD